MLPLFELVRHVVLNLVLGVPLITHQRWARSSQCPSRTGRLFLNLVSADEVLDDFLGVLRLVTFLLG